MGTNTLTISSQESRETCDGIYQLLRGEAAFAPPNWKDLVLEKCIRCVVHTPSEAEECSFPTVAAGACSLLSLRRTILGDSEWQARMQNERQKANKT